MQHPAHPASRPRRIPEAAPEPLRPRARPVLGAIRLVLVVAWTVIACTLQAGLIRLPGGAKRRFARFYWRQVCRLLGLGIRRLGRSVAGQGRPVVFVANHSSWLDIPTLGGQLQACFVSKAEVAGWPGVGVVARLGRSVFVSRTRAGTGRERDGMTARLRAGDDLLLFPEGTSSDGTRVLPFRSSFLALAEEADPPLIQPVSVVYDRLGTLPALRRNRAQFAWYGGMDLAPHLWSLAQRRGLRATVLFHPPIDPRDHPSRKAIAQLAGEVVAAGAATLRQHREPAPVLSAPAAARPPPC